MKSKVTEKYYTWVRGLRKFKLIFHSFLFSLITQNFYFYIVNTKLQQQWENERNERKKRRFWTIFYFIIFLQNVDVANLLLIFI